MEEQLTKVDKTKNRIYIYFEGTLNLERALKLQQSYKDAISMCTPGFDVLTYAENYKPGDEKVQKIVAAMTKMAEDAGIRKVARIVGTNPLGGMQINRLAKQKTKYPSRHFATEREALEYLDSKLDE
ncbi:hypothetical protein J7K93_00080 [bacterium]|nr:hypothetical protein [bacterium]